MTSSISRAVLRSAPPRRQGGDRRPDRAGHGPAPEHLDPTGGRGDLVAQRSGQRFVVGPVIQKEQDLQASVARSATVTASGRDRAARASPGGRPGPGTGAAASTMAGSSSSRCSTRRSRAAGVSACPGSARCAPASGEGRTGRRSARGPVARGGRSGHPARRGGQQQRFRGSQPHEVRDEEAMREGSRARSARPTVAGSSAPTASSQAERPASRRPVEANQRCGRGQGHVRVGVRVGEHALHTGRDGRRPQLGGRDSDLETEDPACRLGVVSSATTWSETSWPVSARASSAACTSCGSELSSSGDGGVRRGVVDAERDGVPRSPRRARREG